MARFFPRHGSLDRRLQLLFQPAGFVTVPRLAGAVQPALEQQHRGSQPAAAHREREAGAEYVTVSEGRDGTDYTVKCDRHRWQSEPLVLLPTHGPRCPLCIAERDAAAGQRRYAREAA